MTAGAQAPSKLTWQKRLRGVDLTHAEYRVLMTICSYTDETLGNAHPGWARISEGAHVDPKTAKRAVASLIDKGWLILTARGGNDVGKGRAHVYALGSPPIHKPSTEWPPSTEDKGGAQAA